MLGLGLLPFLKIAQFSLLYSVAAWLPKMSFEKKKI